MDAREFFAGDPRTHYEFHLTYPELFTPTPKLRCDLVEGSGTCGSTSG
ncbi:MAG: hypothetical protein SPI77_01960 [Corynebacterium sp.]|nr:hypothetical protein [Corynebacterium sp.]